MPSHKRYIRKKPRPPGPPLGPSFTSTTPYERYRLAEHSLVEVIGLLRGAPCPEPTKSAQLLRRIEDLQCTARALLRNGQRIEPEKVTEVLRQIEEQRWKALALLWSEERPDPKNVKETLCWIEELRRMYADGHPPFGTYGWREVQIALRRALGAASDLCALLAQIQKGGKPHSGTVRKLRVNEISARPPDASDDGVLADLREHQGTVTERIARELSSNEEGWSSKEGQSEWHRLSYVLMVAGGMMDGEGLEFIRRDLPTFLSAAKKVKSAIRAAIRNCPRDGRGRRPGGDKQFIYELAKVWKHCTGRWPAKTPKGPFYRFMRVCFDPFKQSTPDPSSGDWLVELIAWVAKQETFYKREREKILGISPPTASPQAH